MDELRIDRTYHPLFKEMVASGEMSEEDLRRHIYGQVTVPLAIDQLLKDGEGELTEEDCDRVGTELPPGMYRHIRITEDGDKPRVLGTFYMRTVEGELDELWLAAARKEMPPNPVDVVPETPSFIPFLVGELAPEPRTKREGKRSTPLLPDARGSQGVSGKRPTQMVEVCERSDHDHLWYFLQGHRDGYPVYSTKLAPALLHLRDAGCKKASLSLLRQVIDYQQGALKRARMDKGVY